MESFSNLGQLLLVLRHLLDHLWQVSHSLDESYLVVVKRNQSFNILVFFFLGCLSIVCLFVWLFWLFLFVYWISFNTCAESFAPPSLGWIRFSLLNVCDKNICQFFSFHSFNKKWINMNHLFLQYDNDIVIFCRPSASVWRSGWRRQYACVASPPTGRRSRPGSPSCIIVTSERNTGNNICNVCGNMF